MLTQADADKAGDTDTGYPHVNTITLKDGQLEGGCFGADGGTYSVDDNRITFQQHRIRTNSTVTFSRDDEGNLHLDARPADGPGRRVRHASTKPWTRIEGAGTSESASLRLNGTYRYVLTMKDARKEVPDAGDLDSYPHVETWTLRDGRYENPGGLAGSYSVDGNRITFEVPDFGYTLTFTLSIDDEGNLHLKPVPPMDRGDAFVWSYKAWTKID